MLDAPGPWGTGPFTLVNGYSSLKNFIAIIAKEPFAATWVTESEARTSFVTLEANRNYWDVDRGPRLERVVFRNDLSREQALYQCMTSEGQVDIVTGISPSDTKKVNSSRHAKLAAVDANQVLTGIFNRWRSELPFGDRRLREALNLAVNREKLIREGFLGYAKPVPALTPTWALDFPEELQPKPYDPEQARQLLNEVSWPKGRVLRLAAPSEIAHIAQLLAQDIGSALNFQVETIVIPVNEILLGKRAIAEKKLNPDWDILLMGTFAFFSEATPAFIHRDLLGYDGALRVGPELPRFNQLFTEMAAQTDHHQLLMKAKEIDRYVYDEALALFLCAPQALYAVNKNVHFQPYRTTFELAETWVDDRHWSVRKRY